MVSHTALAGGGEGGRERGWVVHWWRWGGGEARSQGPLETYDFILQGVEGAVEAVDGGRQVAPELGGVCES